MSHRDDVLLIAATAAATSAVIAAGALLYFYLSEPPLTRPRIPSTGTEQLSVSTLERHAKYQLPFCGTSNQQKDSHADKEHHALAQLNHASREAVPQLRGRAATLLAGKPDEYILGESAATGLVNEKMPEASKPGRPLPGAVLEAQAKAAAAKVISAEQRHLPRAVLEAQQKNFQKASGQQLVSQNEDASQEPQRRATSPGSVMRGVNQAELSQASTALSAIYKNVGTRHPSNPRRSPRPIAPEASYPASPPRPPPSVSSGSSSSFSAAGSVGTSSVRRRSQLPQSNLSAASSRFSTQLAGGNAISLQTRAPPPVLSIASGSGSTASSSFTSLSSGVASYDSNTRGDLGLQTMPLGSIAASMLSGSTTATDDDVTADDAVQKVVGSSGRSPTLDWGGGGPTLNWELDGGSLELCRFEDGSPWQLGQGSFGTVYKALSHGVQPVAVKIFPTHATPRQHKEFQREVVLLKSCRDGNIVQFLGASQTESQTLMITEFMENGDLYSAIRKDSTGNLLWYKKDKGAGGGEPGLGRQIALDIARGLHFLHRHQVVHFDLKSPNVLLGRQHVAKIADVGLAKILQKDYVSSLQSVGTFAWSAPEVLLGSRCTEKVDIYSLGVMLWELVTGESPVRGQLRPVRVPQDCPAAVAELINRCMCSLPAKRPTAKEVVISLSQPQATGDRSRGSRGVSVTVPIEGKKAADEQEELVNAIVTMCHVIGGPASGITREEAIAAATFKDEMHTYKTYVREVRKTLTMAGVEEEGSKAHTRLEELVASHRAVMVIFMQEHTNAIRRFQFVSLQEAAAYIAKSDRTEKGQNVTPLPTQDQQLARPTLEWPVILESLQLTPHQRKSLVSARGVVSQRLNKITEERRRLMAALHHFVLQRPLSGGFMSAVDHSEGLKSNLEEEGALLQDFHIIFTCKTLTALQQARLEVGAFPCLPDAMTVCGLIAAEGDGQLSPRVLPPLPLALLPQEGGGGAGEGGTETTLEQPSPMSLVSRDTEVSSSGSSTIPPPMRARSL